LKLKKLQLCFSFLVVASLFLSSSYSYAKKKKRPHPPAQIVREIKLTTDCEKSVLSMLAPDVALSTTARQLGLAFPMDEVKKILQYFTGELPLPGNFKLDERASDEARAITRLLIQSYIKELGLTPVIEKFKDGANVSVEIAGSEFPDEVLEVGAHFDSAGEHVPGADDNGSGLSLTLRMVDYFLKAKPKRTIRFVFYDLEESGADGSKAHVQLIKNDPRLFLGAIVIDMIGYMPEEAKNFLAVAEIGKEPKEGDNGADARWRRSLHELAQALFFQYGRFQQGRRLVLSPERDSAKPGTGDHGSYWDAKLPAIFIAAPYEGDYVNPENHSREDTIENMHWDYFTEVSRFLVEAVAWISGATVAPQTADPTVAGQADAKVLIEAAKDLIPPNAVEREPNLLTTSSSFSTSSSLGSESNSKPFEYDDILFEEIQDITGSFVTNFERENLVKLWEDPGTSVLVMNDRKDKGVLLYSNGGQWILRGPKMAKFVLSELRSYYGLYATVGSIDPMFMGANSKDAMRAAVRKLWPNGARTGGKPVTQDGVTFYPEIRSTDFPGMPGKQDKTFREQHLNLKDNSASSRDWDGYD
jgi:hypothetical protein